MTLDDQKPLATEQTRPVRRVVKVTNLKEPNRFFSCRDLDADRLAQAAGWKEWGVE